MPVVDELVAILGYKLEGQQNLKKFQGGIDAAERKARGSSERIAAITTRYGAMLGGAFTGAAVAAGVASAVKQYAALERQMTRIGLAAGATDSETRAATQSVAQMATQLALPLDQAYAGLDALVATGKSMPEALAFLPSILKTAQASGAATEDMAASANSLATSFKVAAPEMQNAFDMLVTGGQAGQFELKDMAQFLPSLTASAAKLGFTGLDGTKKLVAMLQTVRQVSGTSGEAATAVGDAIEKTLSPTVVKAFEKRGIKIQNVLEKAAKSGVNQFEAVVDVLRKATAGMSETERNMFISSIYTDKEARRAITAMIELGDAYQDYQRQVANSAGATEKNLARVLAGTQAAIDRLSNSWSSFVTQLGATAAGPGVPVLDALTKGLQSVDQHQQKQRAIYAGLAKEGKTGVSAEWAQLIASPDDYERWARAGGWEPERLNAERVLGRPTINRPTGGKAGSLDFMRDDYNPPRGGRRRPLSERSPAPSAEQSLGGLIEEAKRNTAAYNAMLQGEISLMRGGEVQGPSQPGLTGNAARPPAPAGRGNYKLRRGGDAQSRIDEALGGSAAVQSVVNDNSQDNRQYPVTVNAPITQNIQQAAQAPAAAAAGIVGAVKQGVQAVPSRMQSGLSPQ